MRFFPKLLITAGLLGVSAAGAYGFLLYEQMRHADEFISALETAHGRKSPGWIRLQFVEKTFLARHLSFEIEASSDSSLHAYISIHFGLKPEIRMGFDSFAPGFLPDLIKKADPEFTGQANWDFTKITGVLAAKPFAMVDGDALLKASALKAGVVAESSWENGWKLERSVFSGDVSSLSLQMENSTFSLAPVSFRLLQHEGELTGKFSSTATLDASDAVLKLDKIRADFFAQAELHSPADSVPLILLGNLLWDPASGQFLIQEKDQPENAFLRISSGNFVLTGNQITLSSPNMHSELASPLLQGNLSKGDNGAPAFRLLLKTPDFLFDTNSEHLDLKNLVSDAGFSFKAGSSSRKPGFKALNAFAEAEGLNLASVPVNVQLKKLTLELQSDDEAERQTAVAAKTERAEFNLGQFFGFIDKGDFQSVAKFAGAKLNQEVLLEIENGNFRHDGAGAEVAKGLLEGSWSAPFAPPFTDLSFDVQGIPIFGTSGAEAASAEPEPREWLPEIRTAVEKGECNAVLKNLYLDTSYGKFGLSGKIGKSPDSTRLLAASLDVFTQNSLILNFIKNFVDIGVVREESPSQFKAEIAGEDVRDKLVISSQGKTIWTFPLLNAPPTDLWNPERCQVLNGKY